MTLQILLTNDDGIHAPGLAVLRRAVDGLGEVSTIAPDHNASGVARGITIGRPLHLRPATYGDGWTGLACDGTPADCVRVGLVGRRCPAPGLVIAGVNDGANMGADITYSGTVGAAFEAALRGFPALAFSVESESPGWLDEAVPVIRGLVELVIARGLPRQSVLNVNLPDRPLVEFAGIRPARLGGASCHDRVFIGRDGAGPDGDGEAPGAGDAESVDEVFVPCEHPTSGGWADTDFDVVGRGYVAVTPLHYDLLDLELLATLADWGLGLEHVRV